MLQLCLTYQKSTFLLVEVKYEFKFRELFVNTPIQTSIDY